MTRVMMGCDPDNAELICVNLKMQRLLCLRATIPAGSLL
jgi:hypothetical protein